jgi:hypothetical protein
MRTAVKNTVCLHAMTDDPAATMGTSRRQGMDRTLEAVEDMHFTVPVDFETLIVYVAAYFTSLAIPLLIHHRPLSSNLFYARIAPS